MQQVTLTKRCVLPHRWCLPPDKMFFQCFCSRQRSWPFDIALKIAPLWNKGGAPGISKMLCKGRRHKKKTKKTAVSNIEICSGVINMQPYLLTTITLPFPNTKHRSFPARGNVSFLFQQAWIRLLYLICLVERPKCWLQANNNQFFTKGQRRGLWCTHTYCKHRYGRRMRWGAAGNASPSRFKTILFVCFLGLLN